MIANACAPTKVGYYFNNLVRRVMVPADSRAQLASGTSACEALNKEINNKFNNVNGMYQATLKVSCAYVELEKLLTHNSAEYMPAARQCTNREVLTHNLVAWRFTEREWSRMLGESNTLNHDQRQAHRHLVRTTLGYRVSGTRKRPAHCPIKRHSFNKKRVRCM